MHGRLRLKPPEPLHPATSNFPTLDDDLFEALSAVLHKRGFSGLQHTITRQVERLAKLNRDSLFEEGWIA